MTDRLSAWIKRQPLFAFYILAFALTWAGWLPQAAYSRGLFPFDSPIFYVLGGVGPLLATYIVTRVTQGNGDDWAIFRPLWQWRAGVIWYIVALFGYSVFWLVPFLLTGGVRAELAKLGAPLLFSFLTYILAAIPEEIAWRGFALPRLQARTNALTASLIVGVLWALWHLPLLLNTYNLMSTYPLGLWFLDVLGRSVVYTWIYNHTRGSLLFVTLFHAVSNTVGAFVGLESVVVTWAVVVLLVAVFGPRRLARGGERPVVQEAAISARQSEAK